jgi:hypothetical protein
MQTEVILKYYWDIFLSHLCEFYPLHKGFIQKYEYELDWNAISKSKAIDWDTDFLDNYQHRFTWHELAWNDSISWTIERIGQFKKRLDWYYLGRNRNLPITEEFIEKFSKKLFVADNNQLLTAKLKKKYDLRVVPGNTHDTQELKRFDPSKTEELFKTYNFHHNQQVLYKKLFLPVVESDGLERIFEDKFDYTQRYYFFEPIQQDIHGLTPEFEITDHNPFGDLQEGPDRLYEVPRFRSFSYYATLLVSENVKAILEKFKLPRHIFHPVKLIHRKLSSETKYFILQIEEDTLTKDLDYLSQRYYFNMITYNEREHGVIENKILKFQEFVKTRTEINKKLDSIGLNVKIYPDEYRLLSDYDLYSYSVHGNFIVNQFLKDTLEMNFPNQMSFRSAQLLKIKIDPKLYNEKKKQTIITAISKVNYKESEEDKYYYAKMKRLESFDKPIDAKPGEDSFTKKEMELNVIFPASFKNKIQAKNLKIKGYKLLPVSGYYLENEYADRFPETYKSVVIAENGVGDSINLILEKNSDYHLQDRLFEFFHESGEYEEI